MILWVIYGCETVPQICVVCKNRNVVRIQNSGFVGSELSSDCEALHLKHKLRATFNTLRCIIGI